MKNDKSVISLPIRIMLGIIATTVIYFCLFIIREITKIWFGDNVYTWWTNILIILISVSVSVLCDYIIQKDK